MLNKVSRSKVTLHESKKRYLVDHVKNEGPSCAVKLNCKKGKMTKVQQEYHRYFGTEMEKTIRQGLHDAEFQFPSKSLN